MHTEIKLIPPCISEKLSRVCYIEKSKVKSDMSFSEADTRHTNEVHPF